jgi:hypothetical protein
MPEKYPEDQFDSAPENLLRVGAHRAPRRKGRGWIGFGWAALATVILVGAGVLALAAINGNIAGPTGFFGAGSTPTATSTPTPTITPVVNAKLHVMVLNGTTATGLATHVGDVLVKDGWTVDSRTNANESNITQTTVYYSNAANVAAALGMVRSLTGAKATAVLTQAFAETGADLTVVIGSDYKDSGQ